MSDQARSAVVQALEVLMIYERALTIIAAYSDKAASELLATTGSYSSFGEPHSVRISRDALRSAEIVVKANA